MLVSPNNNSDKLIKASLRNSKLQEGTLDRVVRKDVFGKDYLSWALNYEEQATKKWPQTATNKGSETATSIMRKKGPAWDSN